MRKTYNSELAQRDQHIANLNQKLSQLSAEFTQEQ